MIITEAHLQDMHQPVLTVTIAKANFVPSIDDESEQKQIVTFGDVVVPGASSAVPGGVFA